MVNWQDPAVQARQYNSVKLATHALVGAYLCEYVMNIGFDFRLSRKREGQSRWVKYVYLACRNVVLVHSVSELAFYDSTDAPRCTFWAKLLVVTMFLGVFLASCLIGIRVVAIWEKHIRMIILVSISLLIVFAFTIFEMVKIAAFWDFESGICIISNPSTALATAVSVSAFDSEESDLEYPLESGYCLGYSGCLRGDTHRCPPPLEP